MRKRHLPVILLPLIIALALLSSPVRFNQQLRNSLAEKALSLSRCFEKTSYKTQATSLQKPVQKWLEARFLAFSQASDAASHLAPFSISPDAQTTEYVIGHVLFRKPSRWNSSLWISKGSEDSPYIRKNSPVLSGDSVIGVIDYVGKKASCVRLITDSGLTPAVRVCRKASDRTLTFALQVLLDAVDNDKLSFKNEDEKKAFLWIIHHLSQEQNLPLEPEFLAKGVLQGTGDALWKAESSLLKGTGFNYDFKDQHGPARDLRTGTAVDPLNEYLPTAPVSIVQVGDLLVTSGMDGIFPEGLKVATVHSIKPLTEGAFTYELLAAPTASDLTNLDYVTILPPQDFDSANLPTHLDIILNQLQKG